ncbi:hypothetical protein [Mycobacterium malmoense]|uniref:hypothetical protein n=1 Tax=Mycobacterium malmoense TaxID=1780 RepID=UPI00114D4A90|nr:hypothetical protein [Mycobacterium malmoense]
MFYTPGWGVVITAGVSLAGVGSTLAGVIVTQVLAARTKSADRQQERALNYEQRVWEAKNDALKSLISACRFVKSLGHLSDAEDADENRRRAAMIRALDQFIERIGDDDGISEVTAYAAEPVRQALEEVLAEVAARRREHKDQLFRLQRVGAQLIAVMRQPVTDDSGAELPEADEVFRRHANLRRERGDALDAIGGASDLDVERVIALCDRVIDVARNDLQSRYTE